MSLKCRPRLVYNYTCPKCGRGCDGLRDPVYSTTCPVCKSTDLCFDSCYKARILIGGREVSFCLPVVICQKCAHHMVVRPRVRTICKSCKIEFDIAMPPESPSSCYLWSLENWPSGEHYHNEHQPRDLAGRCTQSEEIHVPHESGSTGI
jgi:hypothetical protein